jgi:hypothetical protein
MKLLWQLVGGKLGKGTTESRDAGNFIRAFPTTKSAQRWPSPQRLYQRLGRCKLINSFGNERMHQPSTLVRGTTVALPSVRLQEASKREQCDDFYQLAILFPKFTQLLGQHRKKLPLNMLPDVLQSGCHTVLIPTAKSCSKIPNYLGFATGSQKSKIETPPALAA